MGIFFKKRTVASVPAPGAGKTALFVDLATGLPYIKDGDTGTSSSLVGVPTSRVVTAGNGLSGGGDLSSDITLAVNVDAATLDIIADILQLKDGGITDAKFRNSVARSIIGRAAASAGVPTDIVAGADNQVLARTAGVLAFQAISDAMHGNLAGGTDHAVASQAAAGFLAAADKLKIDNWHNNGRFMVNIMDFGADPTGVADSTTAINNAISYLQPGGIVWVPAGNFKVTGTITVSTFHILFKGVSREDSTIITNQGTGDMLVFNSWYCGIEDLTLDASVTRTAGYALKMVDGMNYNFARHSNIVNHQSGVYIGSQLSFIDDMENRNPTGTGGSAVFITTPTPGVGDRYIFRLTTDGPTNVTGYGGLRIDRTASVLLVNSNIIHANIALDVVPQAGYVVPAVYCLNTWFDTSNYGCQLAGSATGTIQRVKFTNCWFGTHQNDGILMTNPNIQGVTFANCDFFNNGRSGTGYGINAQSGDWTVTASRFADNPTAAIRTVAASGHGFKVSDCIIGANSGFIANGAGILLGAGAYTSIDIHENTFTDTVKITDSGATATGVKNIMNNVGLAIPSSPAIAASAAITTTETVVHQLTVPANGLLVGTTLRCKVVGTVSAAATVTFKLHLGTLGTTGDALVATVAAAAAAAGGVDGELCLTVRAVGSSGSVIAAGRITAAAVSGTIAAPAAVTVNTTNQLILSLTLTASAGNTVAQLAFVDVVKQ